MATGNKLKSRNNGSVLESNRASFDEKFLTNLLKPCQSLAFCFAW
jgi:DNA-directed RNA polymerase